VFVPYVWRLGRSLLGFNRSNMLDIWLLAALLVKQIFKQDVVRNVTTLEHDVCARAGVSFMRVLYF
jgi:hypothetical protein